MGAWWMTVGKLDSELGALRAQLGEIEGYPNLRSCSAVLRAVTALAEAEGALRKAAAPPVWGWGTNERALVSAASSLAYATTCLQDAMGLAEHARAARARLDATVR